MNGKCECYLSCFDNFSKVVQDRFDVIFEPLVVVLEQTLFALRESSLSSHCAQENLGLPVHRESSDRN